MTKCDFCPYSQPSGKCYRTLQSCRKPWYKKAIEKMIKALKRIGGVIMARYKVCYSGFAYVKADSAEEAQEKYEEDEYVYDEHYVSQIEEVEDFIVEG